jgi:acetyl-CoA acetyltransferase
VNSADVAVLGVGMHPWGKWGKNFVTYGVHAARTALKDSGVPWQDVDLIVGGETVRNGYGGYVAGATFAHALGWSGARVATSYVACATGAQALDTARARILAGMCEVALVVGSDTTPKGFLAPNAGERWDDPDWLRFRLLGMTNPAYFALYARRRMDLYGATQEDFAKVKVKNARHGLANPNARYRKEVSVEDVLGSAVVSDPLHLLDICATSDGAAAVVLTSVDYARKHGIASPVRVSAVSTVTPTFPNTVMDMPNLSTDSSAVAGEPERTFKESIAHAAYEEAGIGPEDVSLAEVYDLSTALDLDWIEDIGLCKRGEAETLLRAGETTIGGRIPVNPSGGPACFGEAVPAQALAQGCEVTWQLRGQADGRQVEGAKVGITASQGLFGHGSSVLLTVWVIGRRPRRAVGASLAGPDRAGPP